MHVVFLTDTSLVDGAYEAGASVEVTEEQGLALIKAGLAEETHEAKREASHAPPEAAMLDDAVERTTLSRPRGRGI